MFQDMSKTLTESMEPFKDLVNIQTRMLEDISRRQLECTRACIEATMQQTRELPKCQSPEDLMALQRAYAAELEETLRNAGEQNIAALNEAREMIGKLTQDSFTAFAPPQK
ncbi:phasin family protein [Marinobacterium jannaschii]|uniref:phasin family protein n=1 Tax=Marinobacterium jannaschii TaxID=64970 RepID=UPI0004884005|nr:phasin family protein [Marinobacterium jannaschii]